MNSPAELPSGLLLVDKPAGLTSHTVVNRLRAAFSLPKIGHAGTLDPSATGLLIILVGRRATRAAGLLQSHDKVYTGLLRLGAATTTQDADGAFLDTADPSGVSVDDVRAVLAAMTGPQSQIPPMVSALKFHGKPLYRLARQGRVVERPPRPVVIRSFDVEGSLRPCAPAETPPPGDGPQASRAPVAPELLEIPFRVHCSKGTYVRTLCHDAGERLGCHGHLACLRRLSSGGYSVEDAHPYPEILGYSPERFFSLLLPVP